MGEAAKVLLELLAAAQYSQACLMRGSTSARATIPLRRPEALIAELSAAAGVADARVQRLVDALTLDLSRCPDPCLTPIVPVGSEVAAISALIAPGSPSRNLTSLLQLDPMRFGAAGKALGELGAAEAAEVLGRVGKVRLATNVRLRSATGRHLGDLDVVIIDPSERLMVVFEVTWQIGVDGAVEIARALGRAAAKRQQIARYRALLGSVPTAARWPGDWPDVDGYAIHWYVLTRDVLPLEEPPDDVVIRSVQMLRWMLKAGSTLGDLVKLLDHPPTPPHESGPIIEGI
jgi:hypothetical protein